MSKDHIVQDKYLAQWRIPDTENKLNIFIISEQKHKESNSKWPGFWEKDFNVLEDENGTSHLPEQVTAIIDTKGIEAIRKINAVNQEELSGENRSAIAFYVALQYIRTPRHREETDKFMAANIQHFMKKGLQTPDDVGMSKEEILKHKPVNKKEEEALKKVREMSENEINTQVFDFIHSEDFKAGLTKTGHSKSILKVDRLAKELFHFQWIFLIAPPGTSFITSDNPCFTISFQKMNGLLSPKSRVVFPLRPDICIFINPSLKSNKELFLKLGKSEVRDINNLVVSNSYNCLVAKDKPHLQRLLKGFDATSHRKSRDVDVSENGDYVMFNLE